MAKNYSGDEAYARYVKSYGGHRSEKGYLRWKKSRSSEDVRITCTPEKKDFEKWRYSSYCYEGFLVFEGRISVRQFQELEDEIRSVPFSAICFPLDDQFTSYYKQIRFIISFLFGILGIDRFYLGNTGMGLLKLCTLGGAGILWILDFLRLPVLTRKRNCVLLKALIRRNKQLLESSSYKKSVELDDFYNQIGKSQDDENLEDVFDEESEKRIILKDFDETPDTLKAKEKFAIPDTETIRLVYDDSISNSFSEGFVLTDRNLFIKDGKNIECIHVPMTEKISFQKKSLLRFILIGKRKVSLNSIQPVDGFCLYCVLNDKLKELYK